MRKAWKWFMRFLLLPLGYLALSVVLTYYTVNSKRVNEGEKEIYIATNGIHLSLQVPVEYLPPDLINELAMGENPELIGFGWGERNFMLNVPTWADLDAATACSAILWPSPSVMHISRWPERKEWMMPVRMSEQQLNIVLSELLAGFSLEGGKPILLPNKGFDGNDDLFESGMSYSGFNTCNTWINAVFKKADLKACMWTPYSFRLFELYKTKDSGLSSEVGKWN